MKGGSNLDEEIQNIPTLKKTTVAEMSKNSSKTVRYTPKYLPDDRHGTVPTNPTTDEILRKKYRSLISETDDETDITVGIFRLSDLVLPVIARLIKKKPRVIDCEKDLAISDQTYWQTRKRTLESPLIHVCRWSDAGGCLHG